MMKLRGARTNNLKNIDVDLPLKKFTVITGVSGSGKSSLVFDTLYAEGQRRYVESLSTYTRQFLEKMTKPDIDSLDNVSPAIALEQKNHINNSRSTVATMSELYDYFRLLFAKIGHTFCYGCGREVMSDSAQTVATSLSHDPQNSRFYVLSVLDLQGFTKKKWQETRKALVAAGFQRIALSTEKSGDEVHEIVALESPPTKIKAAYLVIDRMSMPENPSKDSRLMDALDQAFEHGLGRIAIAMVGSASDKAWSYRFFSTRFRCDHCEIDYRKPEPQNFSFNSPLGACPGCSGFGYNLELEEELVVPDPRKTLKNGAIDPFTKPAYQDWHHDLIKFCEKHKIGVGKRYEDLSKEQKQLIWKGDGAKKGFPGIEGCFDELKAWKYKLHVRVFIRRYQSQKLCTQCGGSRLRKETLAVKIGKEGNRRDLAEVLAMSVEQSYAYFSHLSLPPHELAIAKDALKQVNGRLQFLTDVGVGYLTLNRLGKTLSGGECQRINLATQLGNKLCSTLYVLDEPSIGLHAADTEKLIALLHQLRDHGNTLVVVEHDLDVIASSDHIVEIGPHAGHRGGEVVAQGELSSILENRGCLTAKYLTGTFSIPRPTARRPSSGKALKIVGACENNLKDVTVEFPLHQLVAVTGLSGSGKTTLVHRTLYNALARLFHKENLSVGKFQRLYGADLLQDVVLLDQRPIGKSARSNPATYLKIYDDIRSVMANQSMSIRRGYTPQYFSFNVDGGRCPVCKGEGEITLDMHFMADIKLPCEECEGKKFKKNILEVEYKRKNIFEILSTTIDEAIDLFREYPAITSKLQILRNVGLGYLQLGQSSTTLSGGESQRLKIASILTSKNDSNMLYIFDEPTTGLHVDDVKRLLKVLHDLVDQKNTVIVIEHNLELISQADWVIDIGPGGGDHGGRVVAAGRPEDVMNVPESLTGRYLKKLEASPDRRILRAHAPGQQSLQV
ncbi:MAG: excinuclease ABC subunit UvrA [Bdellovibrionota bacterium]